LSRCSTWRFSCYGKPNGKHTNRIAQKYVSYLHMSMTKRFASAKMG
jgi:hypothetical protein